MTRILASLLLVLAIAVPAAAAKPAASVSVPDGLHFGDQFTPTVTFTGKLRRGESLWVRVDCSQGGSLVLSDTAFGGYPADGYTRDTTITLGPTPSWSGGPASCLASLYVFDAYSATGAGRTLATDAFEVSA